MYLINMLKEIKQNMNNKTLNILALIVCVLYLIGLSIAIYKIIIWNNEYENCICKGD